MKCTHCDDKVSSHTDVCLGDGVWMHSHCVQIARPVTEGDRANRIHPCMCFDCDKTADFFRVSDELWAQAWPDYKELRTRLSVYNRTIWTYYKVLILCFDCLSRRLKRPLTIEDFDLKHKENAGIALGNKLANQQARQFESTCGELNAILEAVDAALRGEPVSDFMESFPIVRRAMDTRR